MFFKNLQMYRLSGFAMTAEALAEALAPQKFTDATSMDLVRQGWASPRGAGAPLVHAVGGQFLLQLKTEKKLLPSTVVNQMAAARALIEASQPLQTATHAAIAEVRQYNLEQGRKAQLLATSTEQNARYIILLVSTLTLLVTALVGVLLARTLMRQLGGEPASVRAFAARLSAGELDAKTTLKAGDTTSLMASMQQLGASLHGLVTQINRMSSEHDKGEIDAQIDASRFHGSYRSMAQGINDMVNGHIAVKKKAMACIRAFGEGDLSAPLEQFPGKKAVINENRELLRSNVLSLINDM